MKRLFGIGGDKAPEKTIDEVVEHMESRSSHVDSKVKAIDHELLELKKQMATTKGPGLQRLKQRAMMLLRQRKVLDQQYAIICSRLISPFVDRI
jgi:archaellum component FlaC